MRTSVNLVCLGRLSFQAVLFVLLWPLASHADQTSSIEQAHIRVLASSCAACHGTGGNSLGSMPVLAGLDAGYFTQQMLAFKSGERASTVMHHHAKGLTQEEIVSLAEHFSRQSKRPALKPPSR
ncbi:MAG TPA: c-type cytochrome [Methylophilaceae bacterium]|nr:c-type cytochrome [Methylophilaceae bacterium]